MHFICYLLVIMLWPRWFFWIPFDPDLYVVDVYVILAFELRRKMVQTFVSLMNVYPSLTVEEDE
jgi:hypothetical protein